MNCYVNVSDENLITVVVNLEDEQMSLTEAQAALARLQNAVERAAKIELALREIPF